MVSLREFLENSQIQEQLVTRLKQIGDLEKTEARESITAHIQTALENYIAQVYITNCSFDNPDEVQETIEEITYFLSPETKSKIVKECTDDEAYRLGRMFHSLSKKQLPC